MTSQIASVSRAEITRQSKISLSLSDLGMSFSGISVLRNTNVEFIGGEVHTLMGENGAGKSTLVKIISGVQKPTTGKLLIDGQSVEFSSPRDAESYGIAIMHQELSLIPKMTVAENVLLGHEPMRAGLFIDRKALREKARQTLARFGFTLDIDTPVKNLRVGEQQLVEIARALLKDARLLIMDEPTSALSQTEADILMEVIRDLSLEGVAVIYISHRMDEVFEISDRVTVLRDGNHISTKLVSLTSSQELIQMMVGRELDVKSVERKQPPTNEKMLSVEKLTVVEKNRYLLKDISFSLRKGEVLGVAGLLGAGRTELLETLFGARGRNYSGVITLKGQPYKPGTPADAVRNGCALITEDRKGNGLILDDTISENIALPLFPLQSRFGIFSEERREREAKTAITRMRIAAQGPEHVVGKLSGGNQQKVVLGKWLATEPSVLLLDDPTRGIDISAKDEIYKLIGALADDGMAVLFASSEINEFLAVCDRTIVLCEGRITGMLSKEEMTVDAIKHLAMQFI
ncbi:sugar ABC transporter ATP-binding protein [Pseudovibrio sp. Tun.PSC04-5.I4]|uniref:sugar ABC transporter ATP-binding protein n=1 Tax=Pseudovibrio sp. Tun.PSC04-5.I4 TaxID=1798213 RepID=UPI000881542B|nr:sugar ABC transporter ATP-binding protein [Pseudovibrio sp. Tun.PSC04-5.I4]SDQ15885.1 monosaccharide ABC transporter ATP-binding protein, CUT2 family [Pseudovibrio sp. Tun.PSC04-5.I4]